MNLDKHTNSSYLRIKVGNKQYNVLNLVPGEFSRLDISKYTKVIDKEIKSAIFMCAINWYEDYYLRFETSDIQLPFPIFNKGNIKIMKEPTRFFSPSEYSQILLKHFNEPWYVHIDFENIHNMEREETYLHFNHPLIHIIPKSKYNFYEKQHKKNCEEYCDYYSRLLIDRSNNEINDLKKDSLVNGDFVIIHRG